MIKALLALLVASHVVFTIHDPRIDEASALVPLRGGLFATTNDSGDTGRVFVLDGAGATVGVTYWERHPIDTEALAPARPTRTTPRPQSWIWVGDIGDNDAVRKDVQVAEIPVGRGTRTVRPRVYSLTYPDGAHDAETLLCDPATGRLYVGTKGLLGGTLYAAPARLRAGVNRLRPVAPILPMATDGAFFPGGRRVVIRNYLSATVYDWPSMDRVGDFPLPSQPQGEGIGFDAAGTLYASSEGLHSKVITVHVPARLAEGSPGRAEGSPGRGEGSSGRAEGSSGRGEGSSGRGEGSSGRGDNATPRGDNVTPRGDNVTPRGDNVTPRGDNVTPRGDNVTPHGWWGRAGGGAVVVVVFLAAVAVRRRRGAGRR